MFMREITHGSKSSIYVKSNIPEYSQIFCENEYLYIYLYRSKHRSKKKLKIFAKKFGY